MWSAQCQSRTWSQCQNRGTWCQNKTWCWNSTWVQNRTWFQNRTFHSFHLIFILSLADLHLFLLRKLSYGYGSFPSRSPRIYLSYVCDTRRRASVAVSFWIFLGCTVQIYFLEKQQYGSPPPPNNCLDIGTRHRSHKRATWRRFSGLIL